MKFFSSNRLIDERNIINEVYLKRKNQGLFKEKLRQRIYNELFEKKKEEKIHNNI